jgi:predicted ATP-grasp superfamily ATP-dependent carboligase
MMVRALLRDLAGVAGVTLTASRDPRISADELASPGVPVRWLMPATADDVWPLWRHCVDEADAVWPIAPETGGRLERLVETVVAHGKIPLCSTVEAIHITSSKRMTARLLASNGVAVVPTCPVAEPFPDSRHGWVAKPDDGAGAEDTRWFGDLDPMRRWLDQERRRQTHVVQPFVPGAAASLSVLARDGASRLLSCNRQNVTIDDGRIRYRGGVVGGLEARRRAFAPVAAGIAKAIPGLWGYVGIDLVDSPAGPLVIDVNPRLTTSYVGLADAAGCNPAGMVLAMLNVDSNLPETPEAIAPVTVDVDFEEAACHA